MSDARPAATYRGARRNRCKHGGWNPTFYFAGTRKAHGHKLLPRYVPYEIKAQRFKFEQFPVPHWERCKPRPQPHVYRSVVIDRMADAQRFMQGVL